MPTRTKKDTKGCYAQWGSGAKYYYECTNKRARLLAIRKANEQGQAIKAREGAE